MNKFIYLKTRLHNNYGFVYTEVNFDDDIFQSPVKRFLSHKKDMESYLKEKISFDEAFDSLNGTYIIQINKETGAFVKAFIKDELIKLVLIYE